MTDIVERLRSMPAPLVAHNIGENYPLAMGWCREAADEIERLRATLDQTRRFALSGEMDTIVSDEIERMREALKQAGLYAWQGDTFKVMDIVRETIIGKKK